MCVWERKREKVCVCVRDRKKERERKSACVFLSAICPCVKSALCCGICVPPCRWGCTRDDRGDYSAWGPLIPRVGGLLSGSGWNAERARARKVRMKRGCEGRKWRQQVWDECQVPVYLRGPLWSRAGVALILLLLQTSFFTARAAQHAETLIWRAVCKTMTQRELSANEQPEARPVFKRAAHIWCLPRPPSFASVPRELRSPGPREKELSAGTEEP